MLTGVGFRVSQAADAILRPYSQCFGAGQLSAMGYLSGIHPPTILSFVFRGHTITKASMPKP